jgi:polyisoprenoid-binding protein YceI
MRVNKGTIFLTLLLISAPLFAEMQEYQIQPNLSSLNFNVSAQLHMVHGTGGKFEGKITGDPMDITHATMSIKLDPATFNTDNDKRDETMREKSLELAKFPWIEFNSTSIEAPKKELVDQQSVTATVHGTLKLHGVESKITVPVQIVKKGDELTAEGDIALKLDDFNIYRPRVVFVKLQNDISIHFKIAAKKANS